MNIHLKVDLLKQDEWPRLRDLRLASLKENPEAFGGQFESERIFSEIQWREKFVNLEFIVASVDRVDVGIMSVEVLEGDYGATCWIGGCWTNPEYRGQGALRALFRFVDDHGVDKGWQRQGLGVWTDNERAIAAYTAIGFIAAGEKQASERQPGRFYMHMVRDYVSTDNRVEL